MQDSRLDFTKTTSFKRRFGQRFAASLSALLASALCAALLLGMFDGLWAVVSSSSPLSAHEGFMLHADTVAEIVLHAVPFLLSLLVWCVLPLVLIEALYASTRAHPRLCRALLALTSAPLWLAFAWSMTRGPRVAATLGSVPGLILLTGFASAATALFAHALARAPSSLRFSLAVVVAGVCLALDRRLLPGLYLPLHVGLLGAVFLALQLSLYEHLKPGPILPPYIATLALLAGAPLVRPFDVPVDNFYIARHTVFGAQAIEAVGALRERLAGEKAPPSRDTHAWRPGAFDLTQAGERDVIVLSSDGLSPFLIERGRELGIPTEAPFMQSLHERATSFERYYVVWPQTQGSLRALLSGRAHPDGHRPASSPLRLLDHYRARGHITFCSFPFLTGILRDTRSTQSCQVIVPSSTDDEMEQKLVDFLRQVGDAPIFVLMHFLGTHQPHQIAPDLRGAGDAEAQYAKAVQTIDRRLKRIAAAIAARPRPACLWITSDHGHAFGWHRQRGHASSVYEDQIRAPLWSQGCGLAPRAVVTPISTLDLHAFLTGDARVGALHEILTQPGTAPVADPAPTPVVSRLGSYTASISGRDKVIRDARTSSLELYDVVSDVQERDNRAPREPTRAEELARELER